MMKNTLEILDNFLEWAVAENLNIVDVLDHIFAEEAKSKRKLAVSKIHFDSAQSIIRIGNYIGKRKKHQILKMNTYP